MKTNVVRVNFDDMFLDDVVMNIQPYEMESLGEYLKKKRGWLYIAKNPHVPHLKIGRTTKDPWTRAKTLSAAGILEDFEIIYSPNVNSSGKVEEEKFVLRVFNKKLDKRWSGCTHKVIWISFGIQMHFCLASIRSWLN